MNLSPAQLTTLKGHLSTNNNTIAIPAGSGNMVPISSIQNPDNAQDVADWYNTLVTPDFWGWRTSVTKKEITSQLGPEGTSFIWAGNGFITRSVGELECWNQLFNTSLVCNPSLPNVRQAFQDIFSGAGNATNNRTHLLAVSRRKLTRGEQVFASGSGTTGSPATMGVGAEGIITDQNIKDAWAA